MRVNHAGDGLSPLLGEDLPRYLRDALLAQGAGRRVGCDCDLGVAPERMPLGQRLGAEHIQRGAGQVAAVEQRDQVLVHQMRAASHVDDETARHQARQVARVHDVLGLGRKRQQAHQHARCTQKSVELPLAREALHARHGLGLAAPTQHRKFKMGHGLGHPSPSTPRPMMPTGYSARLRGLR